MRLSCDIIRFWKAPLFDDDVIAVVLWWSTTGIKAETLFDQKGLKEKEREMRMEVQYQRSDTIITSITSKTVRMLGFHYWRPICQIIAALQVSAGRGGGGVGVAEGGVVNF